jgi:hypothetical protein
MLLILHSVPAVLPFGLPASCPVLVAFPRNCGELAIGSSCFEQLIKTKLSSKPKANREKRWIGFFIRLILVFAYSFRFSAFAAVLKMLASKKTAINNYVAVTFLR